MNNADNERKLGIIGIFLSPLGEPEPNSDLACVLFAINFN